MKKRKMQFAAWGILGIALFAFVGTFVLSLTASRPKTLGAQEGMLSALPSTPNCVSTQTEQGSQWMAPLTFDADITVAMQRIRDVVESMPGATIVEADDQYLYAEFRSPLFRFVDDVEFLIEPETKRIHFRSASRVGYSDLGVNRERMEQFRRRFEAVKHQN